LKHVGPADFRRIIPSIIFAEEVVPVGMDLPTLLHDYALLVNTSHAVCVFVEFTIYFFSLGFNEELYSLQCC
jgi:hypothetical protein